jgi:hypothetical protein
LDRHRPVELDQSSLRSSATKEGGDEGNKV